MQREGDDSAGKRDLFPHEAAKLLGLTSVAIRAYDERLRVTRTLGGHRRYPWAPIAAVLAERGKTAVHPDDVAGPARE